MPLTADYVYSRQTLLAGLFFIVLIVLLAIGTVYSHTLILIISILLPICILILVKPLAGLALIIVPVFLLNISFNVDSPYRQANEIVPFAIIPIFLLYIILSPKIVQGIRYSNDYVKKIILLMFFFFGWAAISLFWTHDLYHATNMITTLLISIIMIPAFLALVKDKEHLYKVLNIFPFIGLVLGIALLISKWHSGTKQISIFHGVVFSISLITDEKRPGGFASPNMAAAIMNMFLFIDIALINRGNLLKKIALGLVAIFLIVCSLLTASKAGAASLFVGLFLLVFIVPYLQEWKIRITIIFLLFMSFMLAIVGEFLVKRVQLLIEKGMSITGDRLGWWAKGFSKLMDTYGIGLGIGGFLKYIDPVPGVHSLYFSLLFDLGVVGFLLFMIIIAFLVNNLRKAFKICRDRETIFIMYCFVVNLITFGIQALFNEDFHSMHFWLLMSLMLTVLKIALKTDGGALNTSPEYVKG